MSLPAPLNKFLEQLGVDHVLTPYEAMPWSSHDAENEKTCTAEVRMDGDGETIVAEAQLMYDDPPPDTLPMEQICLIKARPTNKKWTVDFLRVRGAPYGEDIYNWQEKSCRFFQSLVAHLIRDEIPDIDDMLEAAFTDEERFSDQYGGGGGKKPKIDTAGLMNNKKSGF